MTEENCVVLIPAYNAEDMIEKTLYAVRDLQGPDSIVVIDDASTDETAKRSGEFGAEVLVLEKNVGKSGALRAGVRSRIDAKVFVLIDADTQFSAVGIQPLIDSVINDECDLAIGVLPPAQGRGGFGIVKRFAAWGIRKACGFEATAPLSGQRVVRSEYIRHLRTHGYGLEVAMTIDAVRRGARVKEMEVDMDHDHRGRGLAGFAHRADQGGDIAAALIPRLIKRT